MAYTLSNKYAKNLGKRTVLVQLIIKNVVTCFFGTQCIYKQAASYWSLRSVVCGLPLSLQRLPCRSEFVYKFDDKFVSEV